MFSDCRCWDRDFSIQLYITDRHLCKEERKSKDWTEVVAKVWRRSKKSQPVLREVWSIYDASELGAFSPNRQVFKLYQSGAGGSLPLGRVCACARWLSTAEWSRHWTGWCSHLKRDQMASLSGLSQHTFQMGKKKNGPKSWIDCQWEDTILSNKSMEM